MVESAENTPDLSLDLPKLLEAAQEHHQRGDLEQAESGYQRVLKERPDDFVANHLMGVLRNQQGDVEAAVAFFSHALRLNPRSPLAHLNMGMALWQLNRTQEALLHFQHSLRFKPDQPEALLNAATALSMLGRHPEALGYLDKLLVLCPDFPEAHLNRGMVLRELDRLEEALQSCERALSLNPRHADALNFCGNLYMDLDRPEEALAAYEQTLALEPGHSEALKNKANPLLSLKIRIGAKKKEVQQAPGHFSEGTPWGSSEGRKLLLLLPKFVTGSDGECGEFPVEADFYHHFEASFVKLNYTVYKPEWIIQSGKMKIDLESLNQLLDEHVFNCCIAEINYKINDRTTSKAWQNNQSISEKLKSRTKCIITMIGDGYPRGGVLEVLEEAHRTSDVVWAPYEGVIGMLQLFDKKELINKIHTSMVIPTVFHQTPPEKLLKKRTYEISFTGTPKMARLNAVAEFCRLDLVNIFVNTTTRNFTIPNNSKSMNSFFDILDNSTTTITSSARTPDAAEMKFDHLKVQFPEVFSGRFVEAIARGCMPLYVAKDSQDHPPLPDLMENIHYLRVQNVPDYHRVLRTIRGFDPAITEKNLSDYHAAYLSPEASLRPLLERQEALAATGRV